MTHKIINATEVRNGTVITIEGEPCAVKSFDVSKTGKHGHSKVRVEAVGLTDGRKRVIAVPGHDRFEVPLILKKRAQVLSVGDKVSVMDLENYETIELKMPKNFDEELEPEDQIEYWDIEEIKIIKRKF
ncbi:MAG: translation initiation factor IF-5A [Nanoarchaeota archaeon]|nr:translation initiation factor IF-5A [Nanoarchaeota archaeon]